MMTIASQNPYFIRVDADIFYVASLDKARQLLEKMIALAPGAAQLAVDANLTRGIPVKCPKVHGPPEIRSAVRIIQKQLKQIYREAELCVLVHTQLRREDNSVLTLLMA